MTLEAPPLCEVFCRTGSGRDAAGQAAPLAGRALSRAFASARYFLTTRSTSPGASAGGPRARSRRWPRRVICGTPATGPLLELRRRHGWDRLFPPFAKAGEVLGTLRPSLPARTRPSRRRRDPLRRARQQRQSVSLQGSRLADRAILSTGTWMIAFDRGCPLERSRRPRDGVERRRGRRARSPRPLP